MEGAPKITKIIEEPIHATRLMKIMVLGFKTFDMKIPKNFQRIKQFIGILLKLFYGPYAYNLPVTLPVIKPPL